MNLFLYKIESGKWVCRRFYIKDTIRHRNYKLPAIVFNNGRLRYFEENNYVYLPN